LRLINGTTTTNTTTTINRSTTTANRAKTIISSIKALKKNSNRDGIPGDQTDEFNTGLTKEEARK
jgi:hypothetical protein